MAKVKEGAKRLSLIIAALAFVASSVGVTVLYVIQNNNQNKEQQEQLDLIKQMQEQQAACPVGPQEAKKVSPAPTAPKNPIIESITELKTEDLTVGEGEEVAEGDCVLLFFHGTLAKNGTAFAGGDNYAEGIPYQSSSTSFVPGFSNGLIGMKPGGERRILIPSAEGYGAQDNGEIPANSDLIFVVKLLEVSKN